MDGIEHVGSFLEAFISVAPAGQKATAAQAIAYFDSDEAQPLYRCLAEHGVEVTPTLVFYPRRSSSAERTVRRCRVTPSSSSEGVQRITRRMYDAGVPLLTGTDTAWTMGVKGTGRAARRVAAR